MDQLNEHIQKVKFYCSETSSMLSNVFVLMHCVHNINAAIFQTNDVNQGDALEHDFSTLYLALILPLKHVLDASLSQVCLVIIIDNINLSFLPKLPV